MDEVIAFNASLTQSEVWSVNQKRGCLNRKRMHIEGNDYPPMSLVFLGFKSFGREGEYCLGRYFFREAQMRDVEANVSNLHDLPNHEAISSAHRQE